MFQTTNQFAFATHNTSPKRPDAICTDAESQPQIAAKTYAASIGQGVNF